jgi:glyoxylase-like metal-dependent hydrolase (beta-lactamase superfamily II)
VLALPGRYSVTALLEAGGRAVIADAGSTADIEPILAALAWLGHGPESVRGVIPTHLHFDHVLGLDPLACRLGVPVLLGEVAWEHVHAGRRLAFARDRRLWRPLATWPLQGLPLPPRADWGELKGTPHHPARFRARTEGPLADGCGLPDLPGWQVMALPGHADDAIGLWHGGAGFLIAGDNLRNFAGGEWNPFVVDAEAFARSRRRLVDLPVRAVVCGHGPVLVGEGLLGRVRTLGVWPP